MLQITYLIPSLLTRFRRREREQGQCPSAQLEEGSPSLRSCDGQDKVVLSQHEYEAKQILIFRVEPFRP